MFNHLELNKDELVKEAKVLTNRTFSAKALFKKMKSICNLSREASCREARENLFVF
jgi:hypothetical protein